PDTTSWAGFTGTDTPYARGDATGLWTGQALVVWGGFSFATGQYLRDGALFNPTTNAWTAMPTVGAPAALYSPPVWTGSEMILWGGSIENSTYTNTGARFDPLTNTWTPTD